MADNAAIYLRISEDRQGEGLGVRRQEHECRNLADRLGWTIAEVYCDNDVSATDRRKKRHDYLRLLADIEAGKIDAILAWAPDRLHRQMRELVHFIDLVNRHSVEIATVVGGQIDLSTAIGRMNAKTLGNIAEFESELRVERIRSKIDELVRDGKVHNGGSRPFGFRRIYDGTGPRRKIVRDEIDKAEAALIKEAKNRVLAGESVYSVIRDFNDRGVRSSTGRRWSIQAMRLMLVSGRIAGLKEHRRKVVGDASWPAIISREDHERLRALLLAPERRRPAAPRRHWLSGSLFCSTCLIAMRVSQRPGDKKLRYVCPLGNGGCGRAIVYDPLELMLRRLVLRRLAEPEFLAELAAREASNDSEVAALSSKIEADERRLRLLSQQLSGEGDDDEEVPELAAAVRTVRRRLGGHRDALARLAGAPALVGLDLVDLGARWDDLAVEQRAALLRLAGIGRVLIKPGRVRGRFDPDRVVIPPPTSRDA